MVRAEPALIGVVVNIAWRKRLDLESVATARIRQNWALDALFVSKNEGGCGTVAGAIDVFCSQTGLVVRVWKVKQTGRHRFIKDLDHVMTPLNRSTFV